MGGGRGLAAELLLRPQTSSWPKEKTLSLVPVGAAWGLIFDLRVQKDTGGRLLTQTQVRVHTHT